ncbi:2643_t:CDS:2 [Acaulospora colombiana]|uniref:2643_t:CDS:1 n=1 Tax=Acaulospora colombiana TaxID=27376 RepID=A0ACA9LCD0_9GLOM|nr:2643_t:CDS:2 [Acaulospora colombiana]
MADNKVNELLVKAREAVSFPVEELTNFLDDGAKNTVPEKEPVFTNQDKVFLDREQSYLRTLQKMKRLLQIKKQYDLSPKDWYFLVKATGEAIPIALVPNHGAVFARLIIDNKDYGVHPFIVQLRGEGHKPLPGIEIGDIGPKLGFNNMDNGFVRFTKVRIPRTNMPMKYSKVSNTGVYSTPPHAKIVYGALVAGRADIIYNSSEFLAKVLTIAIRYSIIRKQGNNYKDSSQESQVLDYQFQQYKLFKGLAIAYMCFFSAKLVKKLYEDNLSKVGQGDVSLMAEVHITSAGLKALCTDLVTESMEEARRCCGGS